VFFLPGNVQRVYARFADAVASRDNEHGATKLLSAGNSASTKGMVPPMSSFLKAVLEDFRISLAHLHPNGLHVLAVFQYTCETFAWVHPSVALFRQYFFAWLKNTDMLTGVVTFYLQENMPHRFIALDRKKKVDEWRHKWCYAFFDEPCSALAELASPPTKIDRWRGDEQTEEFVPIHEHIEELRRQG
jgi:hypothetical protein